MRCLASLLWLFLLLAARKATAQYLVKKITQPISIDGRLDEKLWDSLPVLENFIQNFPTDTLVARSKTVVRMVYDNRNLYVAATCYDTLTGNYVIQSLKRDFSITRTDALVLWLSPLNDKTNGFSFGTNPYGVQREGLVAVAGMQGVSTAWDNKWYCETSWRADAWTAEFQIPFKTLRYKKGAQVWGMNVARLDFKRNENSTWQRVPRSFNISHLGFGGELHFEQPLKKVGANLALIPYLIGGANFDYTKGKTAIKNLAGVGFDAKLGVTSSLNLDLTVNPDFAQVEVDDQILNLDRFEIFLPERRQFFIENGDLFDQFGFSRIRPFFSRRIGLYINNGVAKNIPIIGGVRLSGSIDEDWRIGIMNMQTMLDKEAGALAQNFSVAAITRRVFDRSNVGIIAVNKFNIDPTKSARQNYNTVGGIDFNLYSKNNFWRGKAFYHHSFAEKQSVNAGAHAVWLMYHTPNWNIHWNHEYIGKDYRADVGFVQRVGVVRLEPSFAYTHYFKEKKLFSQTFGLYNSSYYNPYNKMESTDQIIRGSYTLNFKSSAVLSVHYNEVQMRLQRPFTLSGVLPVAIPAGNYWYRNGELSYASDFRKKFSYGARINAGSFIVGYRINYVCSLLYRFQPYGSINLAAERNELLLPAPYKSASITLLSSRLEVSFSRNVFFNSIVQYNTQVKNFGTNIRLQWRFKPMSDLFIVYTDNYTDQFEKQTRAFVLKFNYWFAI